MRAAGAELGTGARAPLADRQADPSTPPTKRAGDFAMNDDLTLFRLLNALDVRPVRVPDLPEPGIGIREHGILLLDADLTPAHRSDALEWALRSARPN